LGCLKKHYRKKLPNEPLEVEKLFTREGAPGLKCPACNI
jgi:hypothetical protein